MQRGQSIRVAWTLLTVAALGMHASCDTRKVTPPGPGVSENFAVVETEGDAECDGLDESHCMYPFPSDHFVKVDGVSRRVSLGPNVLPINKKGEAMDPSFYRRYDGFSTVSPIHFRINAATLNGVADHTRIAETVTLKSKTVIIEAETGRLMPHWVEFDHFTEDAGGEPLMIIRLAKPLAFNQRYIVALRGLTRADGTLAPASRSFSALRDRSVSVVRGIHARREHFETAIFAPLTALGVERSGLQLAWDFTTLSEESATGRLRKMRTQLLAALGAEGPAFRVTRVVTYKEGDERYDHWAKTVIGELDVPSFLLPPRDGEPFRRLRTDDKGEVTHAGTETVTFEVHVPHSVLQASGPSPVMQYGHGFLLTRDYATQDFLRAVSDRKGFSMVAINFQGLNTASAGVWLATLLDSVSSFPLLLREPMQGFLNHWALSRLIKQGLLSAPELMQNGHSLLDPTRLVYYGNSQGGTTGCLIMALQAEITRGILGVPGGAFSMLLHQSSEFQPFVGVIKGAYPEINELAALFAIIQQGFNEIEPLHYAHRISRETFDGLPVHDVQLRVAKEDAQVDNEISFMMARAIGAKLMVPAVRPIFGLETATFPTTGSTIVEYDFGVPDNPRPNAPAPKETDTHGLLRRHPLGQDQYWHFLMTGETIAVCDGPCDPN